MIEFGRGDFVVYHSLKQLSYLVFVGVHSWAKLEAMMIAGCGRERRHLKVWVRWWGNSISAFLGKMLSDGGEITRVCTVASSNTHPFLFTKPAENGLSTF
jgi:hypothetical protein